MFDVCFRLLSLSLVRSVVLNVWFGFLSLAVACSRWLPLALILDDLLSFAFARSFLLALSLACSHVGWFTVVCFRLLSLAFARSLSLSFGFICCRFLSPALARSRSLSLALSRSHLG